MRRVNRDQRTRIRLTLNGRPVSAEAEPRMLLSDFLRDDLALPGTKRGCETGICGACSVLVDGRVVKSCLSLAVQARGKAITIVSSSFLKPRAARTSSAPGSARGDRRTTNGTLTWA